MNGWYLPIVAIRRIRDSNPEIDMNQDTTLRWLKFGSALTIFFGILVAAAATPFGAMPTQFLADLIFFPIDGAQDISAPETRLMSAIGGGVMAGWGVLLWMLSTQLFPSDQRLAARLIIASIVTWFVIDSAGSIIAGAPLNAAFNVSFLFIFCVPLWRYR
jgi:hypothetical protein